MPPIGRRLGHRRGLELDILPLRHYGVSISATKILTSEVFCQPPDRCPHIAGVSARGISQNRPLCTVFSRISLLRQWHYPCIAKVASRSREPGREEARNESRQTAIGPDNPQQGCT